MAYAAPTIGPAGLVIPSYQDIFLDNLQQYQKIFGPNSYIGIDSAIYQLLSILSLKQSDTMMALQFAYNQSSPATAIGAGLDRIVKVNGIARLPYTFSTAVLVVTGTAGTLITNGVAQDGSGNQWLLTSPVTIPLGGELNVLATCSTPGVIAAEPNTITTIATPQSGWTSVTNPAPADAGTTIESDSQLRARQAISTALPSKTMLDGTIADIVQIPGVTRQNVLENYTSAVDSFGNPPHSITAVVEGGTALAVATAIYNNRGIGCYTNGQVNGVTTPQTVTVTIDDPVNGYPLNINFLTPSFVPIFVTLQVHLLEGGTSATLLAIQNDVNNYLNSLQIGEAVIWSELFGAALQARNNPDSPIFSIKGITSGLTPSPVGTVDIPLTFNEVSEGILANVVVVSV